jgi:hypothetical protein
MGWVAGVAAKRSPQPLGAHYRSTPATPLYRLEAALAGGPVWQKTVYNLWLMVLAFPPVHYRNCRVPVEHDSVLRFFGVAF